MRVKVAIPWAMAGMRALLGPGIVLAARAGAKGRWMALIVLVALVSDIFDGILARRWGCDTPAVRLFDTVADTIFYLGVAVAMWVYRPGVLRGVWVLLVVLGAMEMLRYLYDFWKFGKGASYHSYLAKTWGLVMGVAVIAILGWDRWQPLLAVALVLGILCDAEGLAMSLILPEWRNDVKSFGRALTLRREILRGR